MSTLYVCVLQQSSWRSCHKEIKAISLTKPLVLMLCVLPEIYIFKESLRLHALAAALMECGIFLALVSVMSFCGYKGTPLHRCGWSGAAEVVYMQVMWRSAIVAWNYAFIWTVQTTLMANKNGILVVLVGEGTDFFKLSSEICLCAPLCTVSITKKIQCVVYFV